MLCWANFVAFWGNGGHRYETGGTFARGCGRLNETDIASASEKRARHGRKWCAEVMWVSAAAEFARAKVLSVSIWWKCSPVGCRRIHLRWLLCPWAVAGSGRASRRHTEPDNSDPAPLVWRAPEGPESADGERAGRRPRAHRAARNNRGAISSPAQQACEAKPQELGGVTTHGSVGRERNPEIPRASAMSEAQRAPGTPRDDPINETTSSVDQPRPRRSERVTAPSRLASRAPEGASARGTCAYVGSGAPSRWAS